MLKRAFDATAAALGLVVLSPVLLLAAAAIRLTSPGPVLFRQERVGRDFRPFRICKFRTMRVGPPPAVQVTAGDDPRITPVGRVLRRFKVDELPQLLNVLRGEMSLVGPRPEVPKYVQMFAKEYAAILRVRPGITDPASLLFRDEAALLGRSPDPERTYIEEVLPQKLRLAAEYVAGASFTGDLGLIFRTLFHVARPRSG
jgi:lipopolysaccharide/colanic/teichoic acid biosynthesis glycosyltransferase